jgi:alanyl-tRNA synthetase
MILEIALSLSHMTILYFYYFSARFHKQIQTSAFVVQYWKELVVFFTMSIDDLQKYLIWAIFDPI